MERNEKTKQALIEIIKNYSITDASKILGVSRKTIYKYIHIFGIEEETLGKKDINKILGNMIARIESESKLS